MAYGYGVSFTPLQILTFYNAIANEGEMVKPRFLNQISHFGNSPNQVFSKQVLNPSICSDETLRKVNKMMFNVIDKDWGTAHSIKDPLLTMAGKTGTVQVVRISETEREKGLIKNEDRPWQKRDHALFVGYAPASKPKYSISVVVEHGGSGSSIAAPIARDVFKYIFKV